MQLPVKASWFPLVPKFHPLLHLSGKGFGVSYSVSHFDIVVLFLCSFVGLCLHVPHPAIRRVRGGGSEGGTG